jgi:hypothetical protein
VSDIRFLALGVPLGEWGRFVFLVLRKELFLFVPDILVFESADVEGLLISGISVDVDGDWM